MMLGINLLLTIFVNYIYYEFKRLIIFTIKVVLINNKCKIN